nr:hypothetical protein [Providencia stuartii]ELR5082465.1 hypothetical protein [Providencia stuartii]
MNISDWFSGIAAFAAVVSAAGTMFTAYIAYKALSAWKPQREVELRDRFRLSLLDYKLLVERLPEHVDENKNAELIEKISHAKELCDKTWDLTDYKKNRRLAKYYEQLGTKHGFFMAFQIEQKELLEHCKQTIIRLDE